MKTEAPHNGNLIRAAAQALGKDGEPGVTEIIDYIKDHNRVDVSKAYISNTMKEIRGAIATAVAVTEAPRARPGAAMTAMDFVAMTKQLKQLADRVGGKEALK